VRTLNDSFPSLKNTAITPRQQQQQQQQRYSDTREHRTHQLTVKSSAGHCTDAIDTNPGEFYPPPLESSTIPSLPLENSGNNATATTTDDSIEQRN